MARSKLAAVAAVAVIAVALGGCPDDNNTYVTVCPVIRQYDSAFLNRALTEYRALPEGSAIKQMFGDYQNLRDQVRKCKG